MITPSVSADETLDSAVSKSYLWPNDFPALPRTHERQHAMTDINAFIEDKVKNNDVFLFMKGSPDFPQCGFSGQVVQILNYLGLDYASANVLESAELRDGIKAYTNWPTIPQLYVKGEFIGGSDIVREMFQSGELKTLLAEQGLIEA